MRGRRRSDRRRRSRNRRRHPAEPARFGDARLHLAAERAVGRLALCELLPVLHRQRIVAPIECRGAGERERLGLDRIDRERAINELERLALQVALVRHCERVGEVGEQVRVARAQRRCLAIRGDGIGMLAERDIRAAEHQPAFGIVGLALHPLGELVDHRHDLLGRRRLRSSARRRLRSAGYQRQMRRRADADVAEAGDGEDEYRERHRERCRRSPQRAREPCDADHAEHHSEQHEPGHGVVPSSAASGSKRSSPMRWRRRSTTINAATPPTSNTPGPNHNSQVVDFTGGR